MCSPCREEIYDKNSKEIPIGLSGHKIVCDISDNGIFVVGGWNQEFESEPEDTDRHYVRQVWKYNLTNKLWTKLKSENPPLSLASHSLTKLDANRLLLYGGSMSCRNTMGNSNETYLYNIKNEQWQKLETTGTRCTVENGHWFGQAMCKHDDNVFVSTGIDNFSSNSDALKIHKLNLHNLNWEYLSSEETEPTCRVRHEMIYFQNKLFILGGGTDFRTNAYELSKLPCFDLQSNSWSTVTTIPDNVNGWPKPRMCHTAVMFGDSVYVTGGYCDRQAEDNPNWSVVHSWNDIWRLHLPTLKWTLFPFKLPVPLWFHAADVNSDGQMYIYGGCTDLDYYERSNKMYKICLDSIPRLETITWDTLVKFSRPLALRSKSDDTLFEMGLNHRHVSKVRW